jgi:hypothetical protein
VLKLKKNNSGANGLIWGIEEYNIPIKHGLYTENEVSGGRGVSKRQITNFLVFQ